MWCFSRYMYSKRRFKAIDRSLLFEMWNAERFRAAMKSTVPTSPPSISVSAVSKMKNKRPRVGLGATAGPDNKENLMKGILIVS